MEPESLEYKGHRIELRVHNDNMLFGREDDDLRGREVESELLIDNAPIQYGQLSDGQYFLHKYAYDWHENLIDLARSFIDYQSSTDESRREAELKEGQ